MSRMIFAVLWCGVIAVSSPCFAQTVSDELSDGTILTRLFASRDYCKKIDAANAAAFDTAVDTMTADSPAELEAFKAKPDLAAIIAKGVADFENRDKDPQTAGSGKAMCANMLIVGN